MLHRDQVARMNAGRDFAGQIETAAPGLAPGTLAAILKVLVEEGGLTWNALLRIIALLAQQGQVFAPVSFARVKELEEQVKAYEGMKEGAAIRIRELEEQVARSAQKVEAPPQQPQARRRY